MNDTATRRPALLVLLLLFIVALVPRLIGLQWGLPTEQRWYSYHPDEREIAFAVGSLDFFGGDFNPNFFNYPSLYIYLTYIVHALANGLGLMGTTQAPASNAPAVWPLLHDIILSGRVVTAVLGAATVPLVYLLGREISGHRVGLLAALLLALLPGHVQHSHFATVDVPMTFFVALSLWLATRALRQHQEANDRQEKDSNPHVSRSRLKLLLLASGAAGLAAATKYNGVLVLAAPLAALWASRQRHWPSNAGLMIGTAVLGFLIGCPYSILSFREFWGDGKNLGFAYELFVHPRLGSGEIFQNTGNGWWYHLTFNLPFVMTVPVLAVVLAGLFATVAAVRDKDHDRVLKKALILPITAFSLLYFFSLGFSQVRFLRYTLPLLPAFCVFAVPGVEFLSQKFFSPARASLAERIIAGALCAFLLIATFGVLVPLTQADPRDQAIAWLNENGGAAPVTVGLAEPPWFFTPPLSPSAGLRVPALSQPPGADDRYMLRVTGFDAQRLKAEKPRWFVMSAFERRDKKRLDNATFKPFMRRLESLYEVKATFKNRSPFILPGRSFVPHDFLYTNPKVNVYRLKE